MTDPITWEDFARVDMRVGRIVEVEDFPEARRPAWKLRVDFGADIGVRRSSAQIRTYAREQLEGPAANLGRIIARNARDVNQLIFIGIPDVL